MSNPKPNMNLILTGLLLASLDQSEAYPEAELV